MAEFKGQEFEFPDEIEAKKPQFVEEKIDIEIEDDTPPEDRGRKPMAKPPEDPTEDELSSYDEKVQARIKKFTRGYHDERRAKEQAERERQAAENYARQVLEENKRLQQQLAHGSKEFIATSKSAAEISLAAAKEKYMKAYEAGDAQAQAEAQAAIAQAALKVNKAEEMRPVEIEERQYNPVLPQSDTPKLHPRTQRWVDENNDWYGVDEEMTAAAMGLDRKLQKEYGMDFVGTEKYFQLIDKTMRKRFPEHFEDDQSIDEPEYEEDKPPRRAQKLSTVVAPASRSTSPGRMKLKTSEAEIARRLGVPIEEYARQVAKLRKGA
jgi:hypothetical protein